MRPGREAEAKQQKGFHKAQEDQQRMRQEVRGPKEQDVHRAHRDQRVQQQELFRTQDKHLGRQQHIQQRQEEAHGQHGQKQGTGVDEDPLKQLRRAIEGAGGQVQGEVGGVREAIAFTARELFFAGPGGSRCVDTQRVSCTDCSYITNWLYISDWLHIKGFCFQWLYASIVCNGCCTEFMQ